MNNCSRSREPLLVLDFASFFGGGARFVVNLRALYPEVAFYAFVSDRELAEELQATESPETHVQLALGSGAKTRIRQVIGVIRLLRTTQSSPVVLLNGLTEIKYAPFIRPFAKRVVAILHTEQFCTDGVLSRIRSSIGLQCCHAVLCVAEHLARNLPTRFKSRVTIVSNRVFQRFASSARVAIHDTLRTVVTLGRISNLKGVKDVIDIAEYFPKINFILIGENQLKLTKDRIPSNVRVITYTPDIEPLLRTADVLLNPSRTEASPYVTLEAAALGLPIVASAIPAHRELATIISGLRLYPPGDMVELRAALQLLHPASVREMASLSLFESSRHHNEPASVRRDYAAAFWGIELSISK